MPNRRDPLSVATLLTPRMRVALNDGRTVIREFDEAASKALYRVGTRIMKMHSQEALVRIEYKARGATKDQWFEGCLLLEPADGKIISRRGKDARVRVERVSDGAVLGYQVAKGMNSIVVAPAYLVMKAGS